MWEKEVYLKNGRHVYFFVSKHIHVYNLIKCSISNKGIFIKIQNIRGYMEYSSQSNKEGHGVWGGGGQEVRKLMCTDTSKNWISEFFQQTFVETWTFIFKITASFSGNNFNFSILRIIKWKICGMCNLTYLTLLPLIYIDL